VTVALLAGLLRLSVGGVKSRFTVTLAVALFDDVSITVPVTV